MFGSINIKLIIDFQGTLHVINLNFRTVFPSLFFSINVVGDIVILTRKLKQAKSANKIANSGVNL